MARAGELAQPGPGADEEAVKKNFFFSGVSNADGEILWGYGQWCSLLYPPEVKRDRRLVAIHRHQESTGSSSVAPGGGRCRPLQVPGQCSGPWRRR